MRAQYYPPKNLREIFPQIKPVKIMTDLSNKNILKTKKPPWRILLLVALLSSLAASAVDINEARSFLQEFNQKWEKLDLVKKRADFLFKTNISDANKEQYLGVLNKIYNEQKTLWKQISKYDWSSINDQYIQRQFKLFSTIFFEEILPENKFTELNDIVSNITQIYNAVKSPAATNTGRPSLRDAFVTTKNEPELRDIWLKWRKQVGPPLKTPFLNFVRLMNEAAVLHSVRNAYDVWFQKYDLGDLKIQIKNIWKEIRPFYLQLHAYVRFKLKKKYGEKVIADNAPIPAHLLGNIWGQEWAEIAEFTLPFPGRKDFNIDLSLKKQGYSATSMVKTAENFMYTLNFTTLPKGFWTKSIFEKPGDGRKVDCQGEVFVFDPQDIRLLACIKVNEIGLYEAHFYTALTHTYTTFMHQPFIYNNVAVPGLDVAIGNAIQFHVRSISHLKKIGLMARRQYHVEDILNNLFVNALFEIPVIPYVIALEQWKWDVYSQKIPDDNLNCAYWKFVNEVQGIEAPENRTEADFDPIAKYKDLLTFKLLETFIGTILQFEVYRQLCIEAKQYVPKTKRSLHSCDIYGSFDAGNHLRESLQMGRSKPFPVVLEELTGSSKIKVDGLLEYFLPLHEFLEKENANNGVKVGWGDSRKGCYKGSGGDKVKKL